MNDWVALFYRCRFLWPNDDRFNSDNFGSQPFKSVIEAIQWGEKLREEQLHLQELGTALLSSLTLNLNRDPKSPPVKESDFHHFGRKAQDVYPSKVCDAYLQLFADKQIPDFALDIISGELLQAFIDGKTGQPIDGCRALVGDGLILIAPIIYRQGNIVQIQFGIMDDGVENGPIELTDVDTGDRYLVNVNMIQHAGCAQVFDGFRWTINKVEEVFL